MWHIVIIVIGIHIMVVASLKTNKTIKIVIRVIIMLIIGEPELNRTEGGEGGR